MAANNDVFGGYTTSNYNGQQVITDDRWKQNLQTAANDYNALSGKNLSAKDYDAMINPTTYQARWGSDSSGSGSIGNAGSSGGGLINTVPNTTGQNGLTQAGYSTYAPSSAAASAYAPTKWTVDPNQTVQTQLRGVLDPNSPLMQQAATYAQQQANQRGLLNSSLAVSAAQGAQIERALPIAQQDASTFANAGQYNATAENQAKAQNAQLQTNTSQFNAGSANQAGQFNAGSSNQSNLQNATQNNNYALTLLTTQTQKDIANLNSQNQQALQKLTNDHDTIIRQDANAATLYQQYVTNIGNISTTNTLDAAAKDTAISNQLAALQAGLDMISHVGSLNLSQYFQRDNTALNNPPVYNNGGDKYQ